jgi:hypothetical protein
MEPSKPQTRSGTGRAIELVLVCVAVVASFLAGAWYNPPPKDAASTQQTTAMAYDANLGFPKPDSPRRVDPPQAEPRAVSGRAGSIHDEVAAIKAECQRAASGDWDKWERDTASYRQTLKARVQALKPLDLQAPKTDDSPAQDTGPIASQPLGGIDDFPLCEVGARERLNHLTDPASLDSFRQQRAVVAANRWLRERGIDLIFVPLPKMTSVYIEHFINPCPPDGIIAPRLRQISLELLESDVEVVDAFSLFRFTRDLGEDYLYNTADTHWAPRGMRIMARNLAKRIARYRFGARAEYSLPIFNTLMGPYGLARYQPELKRVFPLQDGWPALSPEQQERAVNAQTTTDLLTKMPNGQALASDPKSPVILMGHSYVDYFRDHLARELNSNLHVFRGGNNTTETFEDFLREPDLLKNCRVLVWITTEQHMTRFHPMPAPILAYAEK